MWDLKPCGKSLKCCRDDLKIYALRSCLMPTEGRSFLRVWTCINHESAVLQATEIINTVGSQCTPLHQINFADCSNNPFIDWITGSRPLTTHTSAIYLNSGNTLFKHCISSLTSIWFEQCQENQISHANLVFQDPSIDISGFCMPVSSDLPHPRREQVVIAG